MKKTNKNILIINRPILELSVAQKIETSKDTHFWIDNLKYIFTDILSIFYDTSCHFQNFNIQGKKKKLIKNKTVFECLTKSL